MIVTLSACSYYNSSYSPSSLERQQTTNFLDKLGHRGLKTTEWNRHKRGFTASGDDYSMQISDSGSLVTFDLDRFEILSDKDSKNLIVENPLQKFVKLLPKLSAPYYWRTEASKTFRSQRERNYNTIEIHYIPTHPSYPIYPNGRFLCTYHLESGRATRFITGTRDFHASIKLKISASDAIKVAQLTRIRIRKQFPKSPQTPRIVGPRSPLQVIHWGNNIHTEEFMKSLPKPSQYNYEEFPQFGYQNAPFQPQYSKYVLCWLVNIDGDICLVNAETGKVHSWRYAEEGPYFKIDKSGNLRFN